MPKQDAGATPHRNLRSGEPVWLRHRRPPVRHSRLPSRLEPEVVIVGAGISGAFLADALVSAGKRVVVLDRRGPLQGSTPASTALLQFEIDTPLSHLSQKIGRHRAARAWWRSASSIEYLRARIADLGIDCDFIERRSVLLPGDVLDRAGLEREAEVRLAAGLRSTLIDRGTLKRLTGIDRPGAILSDGGAEADPVKLAAGLWRAAVARGARIHAPVEVDDVESRRDHVRIRTRSGRTLLAGAIVFATGYELVRLIHPKGYKVTSTFAYATGIQRRLWPSRCLIWEAASPYLYMRTTPSGRVIVGGEDEPFADPERRDRMLPEKTAAIARKLRRLMPKIDPTPRFAWCGSFGESPTGLPLIGQIPRYPNCYAVLGFGGNGITFSATAAQLLQRQLCGLQDPDADLFRIP